MSSETPMVYGDNVLSFINFYSASITDRAAIASQLSALPGANLISQTTLARYVAGFIAEEYNDRHESPFDMAIQAFGDWHLSRFSEAELASSVNAIDANPALWDLRVRPETSYWIAKFSEHEAD